MKTQHRITVARIPPAHRQHRITRRQIDARNADSTYPCLAGTGNNGYEIVEELLTVEVTMGINESHQL
jgi:hypothetical protein